MARPKKTDGEVKDQRVPLVMAPSELQELDDWMHENRIRSRGEAIRRLCQVGIRIPADIATFLASAKSAYDHFHDAFVRSRGKPDAERLEIYEGMLAEAGPDMLQAVIDASMLAGLYQAAASGQDLTESLKEQLKVMDATIDLTMKNFQIGGRSFPDEET